MLRQFLLDLRLYLLKGLGRGRLDLDDAQDVPAERRLDRLARLFERQLERDVGQHLRHFLPLHQPEIDGLGILLGDRRRDHFPILARRERRFGLFRFVLGGRQNLLHLALLGRLELVLALLVLLADLALLNVLEFRDIGGGEARHREGAEFGSAEQVGVAFVEFGQVGLARLAGIPHAGDGECDDVGEPFLATMAVEGLDHRARHVDAGGDRLQQIGARQVAVQPRDQLILGQPVHHQHLVEQGAIEPPVLAPEGWIVVDRAADHLVRHIEPQPRGFLVKQVAVDQLGQQGVEDPELLDLLLVDRAAELGAQPLQRRLQQPLQIVGADAVVADRGDHCVGRVALVIVGPGKDPPEPERDDQEAEQNLDDNRSRSGADGLQHWRADVIVEQDV